MLEGDISVGLMTPRLSIGKKRKQSEEEKGGGKEEGKEVEVLH